MKQILGAFRRTSFGTLAALFLLTVVGVALPQRQASAATLLDRSLQLSSSVPSITGTPKTAGGLNADPGSAANGNKVSHTYIFQVGTTSPIQAIQFQYCDGPFGYLGYAPDTGTACGLISGSKGFSADAAPDASVKTASTLSGLAAATPVTYTVDGTITTDDVAFVTNTTTAISPNAGDYVQVTFTASPDGLKFFKNPNTTYTDSLGGVPANKTFFVHIETYDVPSERNTSTVLDEGTVASSVARSVDINTRVQETLKFSVGTEANPDAPTAACEPLSGTAALALGDANNALSPSTTYSVTSYFRMSTNASSGADVLYAGQTLTSTAGDTIDEIGTTAAPSTTSTEQFGLTIDTTNADNTLSAIVADTPYQSATNYAFDPTSDTAPKLLATSGGFVACETGAVKYIANIANDTEAGLYSTRVAYIAVPSY